MKPTDKTAEIKSLWGIEIYIFKHAVLNEGEKYWFSLRYNKQEIFAQYITWEDIKALSGLVSKLVSLSYNVGNLLDIIKKVGR